MISVCVRKDVKVGLVDGRGGRRGGNCSRNEEMQLSKRLGRLSLQQPFVLHVMPHG